MGQDGSGNELREYGRVSPLSPVAAGVLCALAMVGLSWVVNRGLLRTPLAWRLLPAAVTAASVFLLAVVAEVLVNSAYESLIGHPLWSYRVLPRHEGDVSMLGPLIWPAYGLHLYMTEQSLRRRGRPLMAIINGIDAPLIFEVGGNLLFIALAGEFYAYYLPGDLGHLTSLQVVPIYMLSILVGYFVLDALRAQARSWWWPAGLYGLGLLVVFSG